MFLFKKALKANLFFVLTFVGLMLLYVLLNLNLFHKTKALPPLGIRPYIQRIDSSTPMKFVADKFDSHSVVFLGEVHKRKQDLEFFKDLIPYLYRTKGIKIVGWEFGAADYQKEVDSIVTAPTFDRKKAIRVMRNSNYFWCYEEYLNIFKAVWQLNQGIAQASEKMRFLQLNKPYVPKRWNSSDQAVRLEERKRNFDNILPDIIEQAVLQKGEKVLIYCGLHHSLTKFETPKFFFLKDNYGRAGQRLYMKYPANVFQICLLAPFPPRWWMYKELTNQKDIKYVYPFDGVFNQLYDKEKRPFAVASADPAYADLRDYNSFYAFDQVNGIRLKDFSDGYIMLGAFDQIEAVRAIADWVTTEEELLQVKQVLPDEVSKQIKTIQDLMNYINPDANRREVKKIHSLEKFWQ